VHHHEHPLTGCCPENIIAHHESVSSPTDGKTGNPMSGTVVDRGVTAVYDFDFYLQAQVDMKGIARPAHCNKEEV
jgi:hypothetical protein